MTLERPSTIREKFNPKAKEEGPTIKGVPVEKIEVTWKLLSPEIQNFILKSPKEDFLSRVKELQQTGDGRNADLHILFRRWFKVDEPTESDQAPSAELPIEAEAVVTGNEHAREQKRRPSPEDQKERLFKKTEEGEIVYYVLEGTDFDYEKGLIAAQNLLERPLVRYPTEKEALILLKEFQRKLNTSKGAHGLSKELKPVACFVTDADNAEGTYFYLNPRGESRKVNKGYPPHDTVLFVTVVPDLK
jgi:hypothetical protein